MTDKEQIIIDGVDVRKCEYLKESFTGLICADCNKSNDCSKSPNCYFKQLVRKTQECEELKNKIKKLRKNIALEIGTSDRYRNALEEIEEICHQLLDDEFIRSEAKSILDIINKVEVQK